MDETEKLKAELLNDISVLERYIESLHHEMRVEREHKSDLALVDQLISDGDSQSLELARSILDKEYN